MKQIWSEMQRNLINEHSIIKVLTLMEFAITGRSRKNAMSAGM